MVISIGPNVKWAVQSVGNGLTTTSKTQVQGLFNVTTMGKCAEGQFNDS